MCVLLFIAYSTAIILSVFTFFDFVSTFFVILKEHYIIFSSTFRYLKIRCKDFAQIKFA